MERLLRIPLLGTMTAVVLALAWFLRPLDRSALFPVHFRDGLMGYVTADGRVALPGPWHDADPFDASGFAVVEQDFKHIQHAMIDCFGRNLVESNWLRPFDSAGLARVDRNGMVGYFDRTGALVIPAEWDRGGEFRSGLAPVKRNGKWGFIDTTGRLVIPAEWDDVDLDFGKSFPIAVKRAGKWCFIDRAGKVVNSPDWELGGTFDGSGTAPAIKGGLWGHVDVEGKVVTPFEWDYTFGFEASDRAAVRRGDKSGFIDRSGKVAIPLEWDDAMPFDESGLARVKRGGKWGYIDRTGAVAIPLEWDRAFSFEAANVAVVAKRRDFGDFGAIDRKGRVVLPIRFRRVDVLGTTMPGIIRLRTRDFDEGEPIDEPPAGWIDSIRKVGEMFGWKEPNRIAVCGLYDEEGRLVWSSDGLSERAWMVLAGIAISLLVVVEVGWLVSRSRGAA